MWRNANRLVPNGTKGTAPFSLSNRGAQPLPMSPRTDSRGGPSSKAACRKRRVHPSVSGLSISRCPPTCPLSQRDARSGAVDYLGGASRPGRDHRGEGDRLGFCVMRPVSPLALSGSRLKKVVAFILMVSNMNHTDEGVSSRIFISASPERS